MSVDCELVVMETGNTKGASIPQLRVTSPASAVVSGLAGVAPLVSDVMISSVDVTSGSSHRRRRSGFHGRLRRLSGSKATVKAVCEVTHARREKVGQSVTMTANDASVELRS